MPLEDDALIEVAQFLMHIANTMAYYNTHGDDIPALEWGVTHHDGGWSVHMRMGQLHLISGFDIPSEKQALEMLDLMADAVIDQMRKIFGVEFSSYPTNLSMN